MTDQATLSTIDWSRIVLELRRSGMTDDEIAAHCGRTRNPIWNLANGKCKEPKFAAGVLMLNLHHDRCVT